MEKTMFGGHFPPRGDAERIAQWKPIIFRRALSTKVLAVARTRIEGAWCAYIDAVPGVDGGWVEQDAVLDHGTKLDEKVARVLFPSLADVPYAP